MYAHLNSRATATSPRLTCAFVVLTTSVSFFIAQLDVTIVNVALPRIASGLAASLGELQRVIDAYTLALAVAMLRPGRTAVFAALKPEFSLKHRSVVFAWRQNW